MTTALENCVYCGGDAHGTSGIYSINGKSYACGWCSGTGKVLINTQWDKDYMSSRNTRTVEVRKFLWGKWLFSRVCDCAVVVGLIITGAVLLFGFLTLSCMALKIPVPGL